MSAANDELNEMFGSDDEEERQNNNNVLQQIHAKRLAMNGVLAFHNGTEEAMLLYVSQHATRGSPSSVLAAVDRYCYERHWMMHMGEEKSPIVVKVLQQTLQNHREKQINNTSVESFVIVELGSYCGYSAVTIAQYLHQQQPQQQDEESSTARVEHMFCIEINPSCVQWSKRLIDYAGLSHVVTVIQASAQDCEEWKHYLPKPSIDLLFIDHDKKAYYPDLLAIEQAHLLKTGSIVVADNVLSFNTPLTEYLDHVRDVTRYESSVLYEGFLEYTTEEDRQNSEYIDGMEVSVYRG